MRCVLVTGLGDSYEAMSKSKEALEVEASGSLDTITRGQPPLDG